MKNIITQNIINQLLSLSSKKLELTPEKIIFTSKRFWLFSHEFKLFWGLGWLADLLRGDFKSLNIDKIIYFDKNRVLNGIKVSTGYKAGGGDDSNLDFTLNNKSDIKILEDHILSYGGKLGGASIEGDKIKTVFPFTNPKRWLSYREVIVVGEEGIGHTKKSWFKTRNSFLPYNSIKLFSYSGMINKRINVLGDTSLFLTESISASNFKLIEDKLSKFDLNSEKGKFYKPAILSGKRGFNSSYYLVTSEGVFCKQKKLAGASTIQFLPHKNITDFHKCSSENDNPIKCTGCKKGWASLFAPIVIKGTRSDARAGEGGSVRMMVQGIAFYRWNTLLFFTGSLKRTLKSKS